MCGCGHIRKSSRCSKSVLLHGSPGVQVFWSWAAFKIIESNGFLQIFNRFNREFSPIPDWMVIFYIYIYILYLILPFFYSKKKKHPKQPPKGGTRRPPSLPTSQSAPEAFFPAFVGIRICMFATFLNNLFGLHLPLLVFVVVFCFLLFFEKNLRFWKSKTKCHFLFEETNGGMTMRSIIVLMPCPLQDDDLWKMAFGSGRDKWCPRMTLHGG